MDSDTKLASSGAKFLVASFIVFLIGFWFLLSLGTEPLNELGLIRNSEVVEGKATDSGFDSGYFEDSYYEGWWVDYNFKFDGYYVLYSGRTYYINDFPKNLEKPNLPQRVQIQYLLSNPSINRLSGTGNQTVMSWARSNLLLAVGICVWAFGVIYLFVSGWKVLFNFRGNPLPALVSVTAKVLIYILMIVVAFLTLFVFVSFFEWLGLGQKSFLLGLASTLLVYLVLPVVVMILRDERGSRAGR